MSTVHLAVIGETLKHSLSPEIHKYMYRQLGIEGTYEKIELCPEEVCNVVELMKEKKLMGLNVTMPYKEAVMAYLDELGEDAKAIGAVNTIHLKDGKAYGYNSDHIGIRYMFELQNVSVKGKNVVILGNGGAACAVIYAMKNGGAAKITVVARTIEKAEKLKERFPYIECLTYEDELFGDILINTTPVGMYPNEGESVVEREVIRTFKAAADIVYNPLMTEFLNIAKEEGLKIVTGLSMLVGQAIRSEEIWFGQEIDYRLGNAIHEELSRLF